MKRSTLLLIALVSLLSGPLSAQVSGGNTPATVGRDVLSGETLPPRQGRLAVTIPAGVFRIIDLELE